ncbi:MAG: DMT family transporter [Oscillospiraceae bacterium]
MEITQKQKNAAIIKVLVCAALWSIAGIFIKMIPWNSFVIAGLRSLTAGLVAFSYMRIRGMKLVVNKRSFLAGVALWLTMTLFVCANKLTTAANAIVLQFTAPVFIMLISAVFLGKRFTKADIITVLVTLFGISLFFFDKLEAGSLFGNLVALGAGVAFACYYISLGTSQEDGRLSAIVIANALTFIVSLPFIFITKPELTALPLLYIVILGVVQLGIPYVLLATAAEYCPPLACSLLGALEPLLNPVWVFLFDGEAPGTMALVGGAVVIATISLWCIYNDRAAKKIAATEAAT